MKLVDFKDERIERQVGDPHNRTPHFVQDQDKLAKGDVSGVLYWPVEDHRFGFEWKARAFPPPDAAIKFLDQEFNTGVVIRGGRKKKKEEIVFDKKVWGEVPNLPKGTG